MLDRDSPSYLPKTLLVIAAVWFAASVTAMPLGRFVPALRPWTDREIGLLTPAVLLAVIGLFWLWRHRRSAP
jgi:hypothetical protein